MVLFRLPEGDQLLQKLWKHGTIMGPKQPLHYWPGQVWMSANCGGRWMAADEILGWNDEGLVIRRWEPLSPLTRRVSSGAGFLSHPICCRLITPTRGGGSDLVVPWQIAESQYQAKAILDSDRNTKQGLCRWLWGWHFVTPCIPTAIDMAGREDWMPPAGLTGLLASDASWTSDPLSLDPSAPTQQGIGIVLMPPEGSSQDMQPIYSLSIDCLPLPNVGRAFTLEAIGLVLAVLLTSFVSTSLILSDCKGAVSVIKKKVRSGQRLLQLRQAIAHIRQPPISWVKSHPERRQVKPGFSRADWANHYADEAADGKEIGKDHRQISLATALTALTAHYPTWATCRQQELEILTPSERFLQELMDDYLHSRGLRHQQEGPWSRGALVFATKSRGTLTLRQRVATINLFFGRFDRDRAHPDQKQCACGAGPATLPCWITVCTCKDIGAIKDSLRDKICEDTRPDRTLCQWLLDTLFQQKDIRAWRGNWTCEPFRHLSLTKDTMKTIAKITGSIIEASLTMHSIASARERQQPPVPATAASITARRSTQLRHSQLGSRQLTEFGFTRSQPRPSPSSTATEVWEPP